MAAAAGTPTDPEDVLVTMISNYIRKRRQPDESVYDVLQKAGETFVPRLIGKCAARGFDITFRMILDVLKKMGYERSAMLVEKIDTEARRRNKIEQLMRLRGCPELGISPVNTMQMVADAVLKGTTTDGGDEVLEVVPGRRKRKRCHSRRTRNKK